MVYTIVLFVSRKPGFSIAQFKEHWEGKHIPLLKSIAGPSFPLSHTRNYVARVGGGAGTRAGVSPGVDATSTSPVVLVGNVEAVDWDGYAELKFRDELHFQQFFALVNEPEAAAKIQEDEERFSDSEKFKVVVLGETISTGQD
ncbi:uncharacterized protein BDR25DRAFT_305713 [Lindgomyces ingoldianus]|uniref:Uncharacterized protein n=1 Tax=Lindgomyces ingoldianus TaxID=673940 RepID=A0ACB6QME4_9PLEO|nr:uncharacterized protein BDR25DRAFT_305713 [Lindgomyces ingoldianus]KAF2467316.1 hypothetical protein BDR25DRAFT_305713 [Lindgomyces ingoldianus]